CQSEFQCQSVTRQRLLAVGRLGSSLPERRDQGTSVMSSPHLLRRAVLKMFAGGLAAPLLAQSTKAGTATRFQLACMTLPYANFPLERALEGIASAGYRYVAWGTTHQNSPGRKESVIAANAPDAEAKRLADHCRSMGLEPVMMFSQIYVAAPESV